MHFCALHPQSVSLDFYYGGNIILNKKSVRNLTCIGVLSMITGYPEGSNLTIMNATYAYPKKDFETEKWDKGSITIVAKDNTTGRKGVTYNKRLKKFQARIVLNNKRKYLGVFTTTEEAHAAYCAAATELHGEFARFN